MRRRIALAVLLFGVLVLAGCQAIAEAINQFVKIEVGPTTEEWQIQPTDDETKSLLDFGKQRAERRTSLTVVVSGSFVDSHFGGRNGRAIVRWKKPEMLRIDYEGESDRADGKPVKATFLRPSIHEWRQYDETGKSLQITDWRHADKAAMELSIFRLEPLPWFFRDKTDVARRRWRLELIEPHEEGLLFDMKPANREWPHAGEIVLDPQTGMPKRIQLIRFADGGNASRQELIVDSLEENPRFEAEVFAPWTPEPGDGWTIVRQNMGVKEDADAVLNKNPNQAVAMSRR